MNNVKKNCGSGRGGHPLEIYMMGGNHVSAKKLVKLKKEVLVLVKEDQVLTIKLQICATMLSVVFIPTLYL